MTQEINKNCNYIHDRAQKITEALYRVTEFFPREEPLKWLLRKRALSIFNTTIKINGSSPHERIHFIDEASVAIPKMIKVLELASVGSFISQANFEVLKREYGTLCDFISSKREEFLPEPMLLNTSSIGHKSIGHDMSDRQEQEITAEQPEEKNKKDNNNNNTNGEGNLERKHKIVDFIGKRGWVSVGEVADEVFNGSISSKTVQRDLTALTKQGVVQKEGNKRWRRYGPNGKF